MKCEKVYANYDQNLQNYRIIKILYNPVNSDKIMSEFSD
jgi:hypothetical protein